MAEANEIFKENIANQEQRNHISNAANTQSEKVKTDNTNQNETGMINIRRAWSGINDLLSTNEAYFEYLIERY